MENDPERNSMIRNYRTPLIGDKSTINIELWSSLPGNLDIIIISEGIVIFANQTSKIQKKEKQSGKKRNFRQSLPSTTVAGPSWPDPTVARWKNRRGPGRWKQGETDGGRAEGSVHTGGSELIRTGGCERNPGRSRQGSRGFGLPADGAG